MEFHRGVCPFAWKVVDHSQPLVFHEAGDECAAGVMITHLASNTRGQAAARAWVGAEASAPSAASAAWGVLEARTTSEAAVHQEVFSCEAPIPSLAPIKVVVPSTSNRASYQPPTVRAIREYAVPGC